MGNLTCDRCLAGKHFCGGMGSCPCDICARSWNQSQNNKKRVLYNTGGSVAVKPKKESKPRRPKRSYPTETVREAARMRAIEKMSWAEIGEALGVPTEGIRYAVNNYDVDDTFEPEVPVADTLKVMSNRVEEVIEGLRYAVKAAESTISDLEALLSDMSQ